MTVSSSSVPGDSSPAEGAGKCPVDHQNPASSSLWKVFGGGGRPSSKVGGSPAGPTSDDGGDAGRRRLPASLEEAARHAQTPHPGQRLPLSTHRAESSIPRGTAGEGPGPAEAPSPQPPVHQIGSDSPNWVYPSEQQVFNAMKRKGWRGIEEEAIPSFLQVHNSVNERSWRKLCEWEGQGAGRGGGVGGVDSGVELVRFEGRPTDLSPKAWFLTTFLFQDPPFDRHDWYVDNGIDREKRYVLDFYMREGDTVAGAGASLPRVDVDVRPALDSPRAVWQRGTRIAGELFPGIAREWEKWQQQQQQQQRQARPAGTSAQQQR